MLNQRTISHEVAGESDIGTVPGDMQLPRVLIRWADKLQDRGLGEIGLILTELMKVWGFAGSQILWMLDPLVSHTAVASVATVLENPKMLDQLRSYLADDSGRYGNKGEGL
jgi:hypothetical protein